MQAPLTIILKIQMKIKKILSSLLFFSLLFSHTFADDKNIGSVTKLPIPRFVVIKAKDVNMRSGPGINYASKIHYKCIFTPVEVFNEFDTWRLVRDINGNEGWIHEAMLDGRRYVQIKYSDKMRSTNDEVLLFRLPDEKSNPIARAERGTIGKLKECKKDWCRISFGRLHKGWIQKSNLWGVYANE